MAQKTYTAEEYAKEHGVTVATARKRLHRMVEEGKATSYRGVIDHRSMRRGARSRLVAVYGNTWHLK